MSRMPRAFRMAADDKAPPTKKEAYMRVKKAAALFPEGSDTALVAQRIVKRLEISTRQTWLSSDMEILETCLINDESGACQEWSAAMLALRNLWEESPPGQ
eukprot:CAMPEP_0174958454 /NCGR_PEP_ID=MMETSP0004_2-20121128/2630_1 /TAXON_ID=420556 /ORGANISM="Ochromonas sp., Strain CCMP1393" /LENGTH=100 /DNA_ID=CAMNT_0016206663 /DNA_START=122 /DNA_END=424 /DNA_ORIENTATION=-